jgi:hypothetical protein
MEGRGLDAQNARPGRGPGPAAPDRYPAEIRVWRQDTFLCRALALELAAGTFTFKQLKAARSARRNELKKQRRNTIEDIVSTFTGARDANP